MYAHTFFAKIYFVCFNYINIEQLDCLIGTVDFKTYGCSTYRVVSMYIWMNQLCEPRIYSVLPTTHDKEL
jgi:hypothetical protein